MNQNLTSRQWIEFGHALSDTFTTPDIPFTGAAPMRPVQQVVVVPQAGF